MGPLGEHPQQRGVWDLADVANLGHPVLARLERPQDPPVALGCADFPVDGSVWTGHFG